MTYLHLKLKRITRKSYLFGMIALVMVATLLPFLARNASAAQIENRKVTISSAIASASNVTYAFSFDIASTSDVEGIKFIACTVATATYPGGTCTAPPGMTAGGDGFDNAAITGTTGWTGATAFTVDGTGANDCLAGSNVICIKRTDATTQSLSPASRTVTFNTIKNPSTVNTAFYIGITTYNNNTWTATSGGQIDAGTVAAAITDTLTVTARVAEILQFCVGSTTVDNATGLIATDCPAGLGASAVNLGTLDPGQVNISDGTNIANAVAMLRTNAANGAIVAYRAVPASTGTNHLGALRVSGSSCNVGSVNNDQCLDSQGGTQGTFSVGSQERFGMTIAGVNCGGTTSYSCVYATGNYNLVPQTNYIGKAANAYCSFCNTADSGNGFAWDESGSPITIASSASSTVKQVDDEALVMKFAAVPTIVTPFGSYSVQVDYIATPTF